MPEEALERPALTALTPVLDGVNEAADRKQAVRRRDEAFDEFQEAVREITGELEPKMVAAFERLTGAAFVLREHGIEVKAAFSPPMERALRSWSSRGTTHDLPLWLRETP